MFLSHNASFFLIKMVEDKIYMQTTANNSQFSIYKLDMYMLLVWFI